jgi:hypothetical protein
VSVSLDSGVLQALDTLKTFSEGSTPTIADIGTGSGIIAVVMAKHLPNDQFSLFRFVIAENVIPDTIRLVNTDRLIKEIMLRTLFCTFLLAILSNSLLFAADWSMFHGPDGENRSPDTGLLTSWAEGGPELLWKIDGIGKRLYLRHGTFLYCYDVKAE